MAANIDTLTFRKESVRIQPDIEWKMKYYGSLTSNYI